MAKDGSLDRRGNEAPVSPEQRQTLHRAGMLATLALLALVLVTLPMAIRSMAGTLFGAQQATLYDLINGGEVPPVASTIAAADQTYINLAVVGLNSETGQATLAISGNRVCAASCPTVHLTLLALDDNATQRRGLPPSATITLEPDELIFSESLVLPVRGRPNLYPFDTYDLWLGFAVLVIGPDSKSVPVDLTAIEEGAVITLQNQLSYLEMDPPRTIEPTRAMAVTDPYALPLVKALHFERPDYLKILAVLLILLISASGGIALLRRDVDELLLGIGGLILGIWGIRSVLVNQPLPGVSAIDLALSFVILFLLLGLIVRLTRFFHRGSNWRWPFPR